MTTALLQPEGWDRIENFIGFGNPTARYVFLGMEEGLLSEENLVTDLSARSRYEPYMDLYDAQAKLVDTAKYFGEDPKNQSTWRPMCDLMLRLTHGVAQPSKEQRLRYQADELGRKHGQTLLAELMPYPRKSADPALWPYARFGRFPDYESYRRELLDKRLALLRSVLALQCERKLVVASGKGDWPEFKKLFDANWTFAGPFEWTRIGKLAVVLTPQLSTRAFNAPADLDRFASVVFESLGLPDAMNDGRRGEVGRPRYVPKERVDCAARLKRWVEMVERIQGEMVDLMWQREQIRRVGNMINENPRLLESPKSFLWDVRRWYMYFAAMAVRRQTDRNPKNVSLAQLLTEITQNSQCVTRDLLVSQFDAVYGSHPDSTTKSIIRSQVVDGDWEKWSLADGSLDAAIVEADLRSLESLSKELMKFASSQLAHTSLKAIGKGTKLTFDDMDAAIDVLERLTIKYEALLTGRGGITLVPTEQYDWYQEFTFPWRARK